MRFLPTSIGFRLISTILIGLGVITGYFVYTTYHSFINHSEERILDKLNYVSESIAEKIDGDEHKKLTTQAFSKDTCIKLKEYEPYTSMHNILRSSQEKNHIQTDIYTLFYDSLDSKTKNQEILFGVTSGITPYFRDEYTSHPSELINKFNSGGKLRPYKDENGTWLSAFSPIKDSEGNVVGVVQVDEQFDKFIAEANAIAYREVTYSIIIFAILSAVIILLSKRIIYLENLSKKKLSLAYESLDQKNEEKKLLLQEIHHRVKNNFQIVSSLFEMHARKINDQRISDLFLELRNKISTMSMVHEKLYRSDNIATIDLDIYIEELSEAIVNSYQLLKTVSLSLDLENIKIGIKQSIPIGLLISELLINSMKHAFNGKDQGQIIIKLKEEGDNIILSIGDDGVGITNGKNPDSLGLELVESFALQLNASIEQLEVSGTMFQITFPRDFKEVD